MALMVRITGGKDSTVWTSILVFQNTSRSYLMQNVAAKGWVDIVVFAQFLNEC
jgi:hypothetical protein